MYFNIDILRIVGCFVVLLVFFLFFFCVWLGLALVWFGLVWFGLVWFGLVWFGLVWFGLVWFDLVWSWFLFLFGGLTLVIARVIAMT